MTSRLPSDVASVAIPTKWESTEFSSIICPPRRTRSEGVSLQSFSGSVLSRSDSSHQVTRDGEAGLQPGLSGGMSQVLRIGSGPCHVHPACAWLPSDRECPHPWGWRPASLPSQGRCRILRFCPRGSFAGSPSGGHTCASFLLLRELGRTPDSLGSGGQPSLIGSWPSVS